MTGEIAFCIGGAHFPDEHWNDFVVVVLGWWCDALLQLLNGQCRVSFDFMDGPFSVAAARVDRNELALTGLRYESSVVTGTVPLLDFQEQLIGACGIALASDCKRESQRADFDTLAARMMALRKFRD